jgi:hypothetical protein
MHRVKIPHQKEPLKSGAIMANTVENKKADIRPVMLKEPNMPERFKT